MNYDDAFEPLRSTRASPRTVFSTSCSHASALNAYQKKIVGFSLESLGAGDTVWGTARATPSFQHTIEWTGAELSRRTEGRGGRELFVPA